MSLVSSAGLTFIIVDFLFCISFNLSCHCWCSRVTCLIPVWFTLICAFVWFSAALFCFVFIFALLCHAFHLSLFFLFCMCLANKFVFFWIVYLVHLFCMTLFCWLVCMFWLCLGGILWVHFNSIVLTFVMKININFNC